MLHCERLLLAFKFLFRGTKVTRAFDKTPIRKGCKVRDAHINAYCGSAGWEWLLQWYLAGKASIPVCVLSFDGTGFDRGPRWNGAVQLHFQVAYPG